MPKSPNAVAKIKKASKDYSTGIAVRGPTRLISDSAFLSGQDTATGNIGAVSFNNIAAIHAWVYAAIKAISQNIGVVPLRFTAGPGDDPKPFTDEDSGAKGALAKLFANPNPWMAGFQLMETSAQLMNLDGTVFWALDRENITQIPDSIVVLRATNFKAIMSAPDSQGRQNIVAWLYTDPYTQTPLRLELAQVLMFKFANPYDPIFGLAPISAAARGIMLDILASNYSRAFFENSADPSGVIISEKKLSETQARQIIEWWENRHRGSGSAKKIGILYGGMKYQTTAISQKDMEFLQQRQWSRDEVLAVFKVPKTEISLDENSNFSNTVAQDKGFWQKTLIPILKNFEAVLKGHFIPGLRGTVDPNLKITFDLASVSALQPDFTEQLKAAEALVRIGYPINDVNERLKLGMPKKPWGDLWFTANSTATVEQLVAGKFLPSTPVGSSPSGPSAPGVPQADPNSPDTPRDPTPPSDTGQNSPNNFREYDEIYQSLINPAEEQIKAQLKSYFWRLRAHVLTNVVKNNCVYDLFIWREKLVKRIRPILSKLAISLATKFDKTLTNEFTYSPQWDIFLYDGLLVEVQPLKNNGSTEEILKRVRTVFNQLSDPAKLAEIAKIEIYSLIKKVETS